MVDGGYSCIGPERKGESSVFAGSEIQLDYFENFQSKIKQLQKRYQNKNKNKPK